MSKISTVTKPKPNKKLRSLKEINSIVVAKRNEDIFRFRTCCADARASK